MKDKNSIPDVVYHNLSEFAYTLDLESRIVEIKINGVNQVWNVLDYQTDPKTGFDAYVFEQNDKIVIAFRGTEGDSIPGSGWADLKTDIKHIALKGSVDKKPNPIIKAPVYPRKDIEQTNQFRQALEMTQAVQKKYPNKEISVTGHSLGGALAAYVGAILSLVGVTYNAPSVIDLLPKELENKARDGQFDNIIYNYINPQDSIGAGAITEYELHIGSSYYIGGSYDLENAEEIFTPSARLFNSFLTGDKYHELGHFKFDEFGNLFSPVLTHVTSSKELRHSPRFINGHKEIHVNPDVLLDFAKQLKNNISDIQDRHLRTKSELMSFSHISEYAYIEDIVFESMTGFEDWYERESNWLEDVLVELSTSLKMRGGHPKMSIDMNRSKDFLSEFETLSDMEHIFTRHIDTLRDEQQKLSVLMNNIQHSGLMSGKTHDAYFRKIEYYFDGLTRNIQKMENALAEIIRSRVETKGLLDAEMVKGPKFN